MVKKRQLILFTLLSLGITACIFSNSLRSGDASNAQSGWLMAWLKPLIDPNGLISEEKFHYFIRKAAHFTEFAALGLCLGGVAEAIRRRFWRSSLVFFPLFAVLAVAVTDEFIQSFTGARSSEVKDALLDFSGGVAGLAAAMIVAALCARIAKRRGR